MTGFVVQGHIYTVYSTEILRFILSTCFHDQMNPVCEAL